MWVPEFCALMTKQLQKHLTKGFLVLSLKSVVVLSWRVHACCESALSPNSAFLRVLSVRD